MSVDQMTVIVWTLMGAALVAGFLAGWTFGENRERRRVTKLIPELYMLGVEFGREAEQLGLESEIDRIIRVEKL